MPLASPLPAPCSHLLPGQPCTSRSPPSLWGMGGPALSPISFWVRLGSQPWLLPPPPPRPAPVCAGSWENTEINKYAIRQASSHGRRGVLQKRGSGQILECLRKWLELQASAGLWASHRCSRPGGEGAAAAPQEEEEEEGGWQLPALLSAGVFPHLCICRVQDKACLCWRCDESRGSQPALGVFLPQLNSKLSAGVFGAESRGVHSVQAATWFGVNKLLICSPCFSVTVSLSEYYISALSQTCIIHQVWSL